MNETGLRAIEKLVKERLAYALCGVRGQLLITRYGLCQRAMNIQNAMKPAWSIHCVVASLFIIL
ncbi:MAG: hypothetical protein ABI844_09730, partial [Saprospiraceae bacterium]